MVSDSALREHIECHIQEKSPFNTLELSLAWLLIQMMIFIDHTYGSDSPGQELWPNWGAFLKKVEPLCV